MATAVDIMTRTVVTVSPETAIRDIAALLSGKRFGSVPVVDAEGHLLGIVTEEDIMTRAADVHLPRHVTFLSSIIYLENPQRFEEEAEKILAMHAREIMDEQYATVRPDMPVEELASLMLDEDLRRVLVVDDHARLLGIITRADIVRMLFTSEQLPDTEA